MTFFSSLFPQQRPWSGARGVSAGWLRALLPMGMIALAASTAMSAQLNITNVFVVEAEDFNYARGTTLPIASTMPYLGGAYAGQNLAVSSVDYSRPADGSSPLYRNSAQIPISVSPNLDRTLWQVTQNWRLTRIKGGEWFNYTRTLPPAKYLVYAAMSHGDLGDNLCVGSLSLITSAATNTSQTLAPAKNIWNFKGPGTGDWDVNTIIPLKDSAGRRAVADFTTNTTFRYTATSGDVDYFLFIRAQAPVIDQQPTDLTVIENRDATFSLTLGSDDSAAFQWQTNQVDFLKATNSTFTITPTLQLDGTKVRCVLTNVIGTTISTEVTLHVIPDTAKPVLTRAANSGNQKVRIYFDEAVQVPSGNAGQLFQVSGGVTVTQVALGSEPKSLELSLANPLVYDQPYTVTVSGVQDIAATPNTVVANSQVTFTAVQFLGNDIGKPVTAGSVTRVPGGFDVVGAGTDIGGSSDQFQFSWEPRTGDFDIQVRVQNATITDPFLHAGLMARETLATNASFAATFASSLQLGCVFESRKAPGSAATTVSAPNGVPVNYPQTWLRLSRAGLVFTGYASLDGQAWINLGSITFASISNTVLVGFAVSSESSTTASQVQFRDLGNTQHPDAVGSLPDRERLGVSSRRTGLIFSEIMYHPRPTPGSNAHLEFIEIYNAGSVFEEMDGYQITGGVSYAFPAGLKILPGQFLVVAADPAAVQNAYGITGVLGPWIGSLNNSSDTIQLKDGRGAMKLDMTYSSTPPWPVAADGGGASLVLARPSYGEALPEAWAASARIGGSPGQLDPYLGGDLQNIVINELLSRPAALKSDFVELYNHSTKNVDLSGCIITDDPTTNKFRIPNGTTIEAGAQLAFDSTQMGFGLSAQGETVYLLDPTATRILDAMLFEAQEVGISVGRSPDGASRFVRLATPTPGEPNAARRVESVVINEIMFSPITQNSDDEYVELYNSGAAAVDLSGWKFVAGINYEFPQGTTLPADGYMVVSRNLTRLRSNYANLNNANSVGNYTGSLSDSGERLALAKAVPFLSTNSQNQVSTKFLPVVVSEVNYHGGGRWGVWSDGGGSSLELIDPRADLNLPSNWADSDETQKAEWTLLSLTDTLDNGNSTYPPNRFQVLMQGAGECLVDDIEVFKVGSTNLLLNGNLDSTNSSQKWELNGNHALTTIETNTGFGGTKALHIRSQGDGDTGPNSVRRALQGGLAQGNTATINAKVRWLAGWPEVLLRIQGNWMELPGRLNVPKNLGTPGQANSRKAANVGPAIYEVKHSPALPRAGEPIVVSCRVSDPDNLSTILARYRFDPDKNNLTNVVMNDFGTNGDLVAGDGIFSATLPGRASGVLAFRIEATDAAATPASSVFPENAPAQECLVRFNETLPFGTFPHYHLFSTAATEAARGASTALNNIYRDATLVYGNGRIIYNVGFRDKGSPYHSGAGDFALTMANDDLLLGVRDRVFGTTGNGGPETTGLRGQVANWFSRQMGLPYLHAQYIMFYRNGALHQDSIAEDAEQPSNIFAQSWFPSGVDGELFKIAVWFEDGSTSGAVSATMEPFKNKSGNLDLARYRWNWQLRALDSANNYTNFFKLVESINASGDFVPGLMALADMDEWMHLFAYHRVMGNWDSWTFNVGQNMYLYRQPGDKWRLLPWDIDFVLGLGNGTTDALSDGQDPVMNVRAYANPTFRRMMMRAYQEAIAGPMQPSRYGPQIDSRRNMLVKNKTTGVSAPSDVAAYIDGRREYLRSQIYAADVPLLTITNNGGTDFVSGSAVATISGKAPFAVAGISINGVPYPVTWTGTNSYSIKVPLAAGANVLNLVGLDRQGNPIGKFADTITVTYNGVPQEPKDFVVINEIQYNPLSPKSSFVELWNRSSTTPFDLSNHRLDGIKYVFPPGSFISPNSYLLLVKDRPSFALAYGANIPVFDEFSGSLSSSGELLQLVRPGATPDLDTILNFVQYESVLPWPTNANGFGPSLQLIDATRDTYRVANWATTAIGDVNQVTPGRANATKDSLAAFPSVFLNEVLAHNVAGPVDNAGEHDPYLELYNPGTDAIDLSPYYLTDSYSDLKKWQFPAGTSIGSKQFLVLWLDGQVAQSGPGHLHTSFRIDPSAGSIALVRTQGAAAQASVMDYLNYSNLPADHSYGSYPDGQPSNRRSFYFLTMGAANNPVYPDLKVKVNEIMADNTKTLQDTASGKYSDWFELYNAGTGAVDLTGYRLTDDVTAPNRFVIPSGYSIPAGGYLLVWADGDPTLNLPSRADLHVSFKLSKSGKAVALIAPDDRIVDSITFGSQLADYSYGRYPDGAESPLIYMPVATPRKKNDATKANFPPTLDPVADITAPELSPLTFQVKAKDSNAGQTLTFSLANTPPDGLSVQSTTGVVTWTPNEAQGPADYLVTVEVTDSGTPPMSATVDVLIHVTEVNSAPIISAIPAHDVVANNSLRFFIPSSDTDLPEQNLKYALTGGSPLGAVISADTGEFVWIPSETQIGTFTLTVTVTDDGIPPLSTSADFVVNVKPLPVVPPPKLDVRVETDGTLTLFWVAVDGVNYQLQAKDKLDDSNWTLLGDVVGNAGFAGASGIDPHEQNERYYRVVVFQ